MSRCSLTASTAIRIDLHSAEVVHFTHTTGLAQYVGSSRYGLSAALLWSTPALGMYLHTCPLLPWAFLSAARGDPDPDLNQRTFILAITAEPASDRCLWGVGFTRQPVCGDPLLCKEAPRLLVESSEVTVQSNPVDDVLVTPPADSVVRHAAAYSASPPIQVCGCTMVVLIPTFVARSLTDQGRSSTYITFPTIPSAPVQIMQVLSL